MKELQLYGFFNHTTEGIKKGFKSKKESYLRFSMRLLVMETAVDVKELFDVLESQYNEKSEDQYPIIEGKKYWIKVSE